MVGLNGQPGVTVAVGGGPGGEAADV